MKKIKWGVLYKKGVGFSPKSYSKGGASLYWEIGWKFWKNWSLTLPLPKIRILRVTLVTLGASPEPLVATWLTSVS